MTRNRKLAILIPLALVALIGAWQGLRFWWYHGYSRGTRTGMIRKISVKGSPMCKFLSGEMVLIGSGIAPGQPPEVWTFTVDNDHDDAPVVKALHAAERSAKEVTVEYRQDKGKWWACADTEYYVTGVE